MHEHRLARILAGSLSACLACASLAQAVSGTPSTASKDDINFMKHAAADGVAEVKLGQIALDKSSSAGVRKLAQRIVEDHTKANDKLRLLAQGEQFMLPPGDASPGSADLNDKNGAKFDRAWTEVVVKSHQKAVAMFAKETRQAQDPDVRHYTNESLPVLKAHLQMAQELQDELALPSARDTAMGSHTRMGDSAFDHVASPATAAPVAPAPAASAVHPE